MAVQKRHFFTNPKQLVRSDEHKQILNTSEVGSYDGLLDSYKEYDRIKPVYVVRLKETPIDADPLEYTDTEGEQSILYAIIDGVKYVEYAKANNLDKIFACELTFDNADDRRTIMLQLQRSCHDSYMALFYMIQALWEKHYKGQGYRTDAHDNKDLDEKYLSPDGRKLNIYERLGLELNLSSAKVKHIRKIGLVNPDHFEQIENSRSSLYAAYLACVSEERGDEPPVPGEKPTRYITDQTAPPTFSSPTTTATGEANINYTQPDTETGYDHPDSEAAGNTESENNTDSTHHYNSASTADHNTTDDNYIIVEGICTECGKPTKIKINKNRI